MDLCLIMDVDVDVGNEEGCAGKFNKLALTSISILSNVVLGGGDDGGDGSGVLIFVSSLGFNMQLYKGDNFLRGIFPLLATGFRILMLSSSSEEMTISSGDMSQTELVF